jgi:hypothetical protein
VSIQLTLFVTAENPGRARLHRLLKNSTCGLVLKGRGFQPRRKYRTINSGFSR